MSGIAKVGDKAVGVCMGHYPSPIPVQGTLTVGESTVLTENMPTATVGDTVVFSCGHSGVISTGTSTTLIKNKQIAMIGSIVVGPMFAVITVGSPTVIAN